MLALMDRDGIAVADEPLNISNDNFTMTSTAKVWPLAATEQAACEQKFVEEIRHFQQRGNGSVMTCSCRVDMRTYILLLSAYPSEPVSQLRGI